jgi:hypothetical protein
MTDLSGLLNVIQEGGAKVEEFFCSVDQGATNARVAVSLRFSNNVITPLLEVYKFQARTASVFISGLAVVGDQIASLLKLSSSGGCIAAAGRIMDNGRQVDITNYDGGVEGRIIRVEHLPRTLFPLESTYFINDLESTCYGIYSLHLDGKLSSFFRPLWGAGPQDIKLNPEGCKRHSTDSHILISSFLHLNSSVYYFTSLHLTLLTLLFLLRCCTCYGNWSGRSTSLVLEEL